MKSAVLQPKLQKKTSLSKFAILIKLLW